MRDHAQQGITVIPNQHRIQSDNFQSAMRQSVRRVDNHQQHAAQLAADVDAGRSDDLVGAMVASQKASISFQALTQVRNKLMTAYDDVLKMPL
ncbi:flagellar hook-basal body complex protein FliE [Vibrio sp. ZSDE26]|uniref:Flagellar hook-basal body complex protein FliE n=2 Tax=Vibrio amylolyticus TaxID=2847292 RepID=A0A9X1XI40_9VIBR|nr:flagellar hook-basal body complex protein FliE [Vibrio amylolyticus]